MVNMPFPPQDHYKNTLGAGDDDVLHGWRFLATLRPGTPLIALVSHGRVIERAEAELPTLGFIDDGIWTPELKSWRDLGLDIDEGTLGDGEMATSIGPMPSSGGDYLLMLIAYRRAVESDAPIEEKRKQVSELESDPRFAEYYRRAGIDPDEGLDEHIEEWREISSPVSEVKLSAPPGATWYDLPCGLRVCVVLSNFPRITWKAIQSTRPPKRDHVLRKQLASEVLFDWERMQDMNKVAVPFTPARAVWLFQQGEVGAQLFNTLLAELKAVQEAQPKPVRGSRPRRLPRVAEDGDVGSN